MDAKTLQQKNAQTAESRRAPRGSVSGVSCTAGRIVDFSTRGLRLTSRRRWTEGQRLAIRLKGVGTPPEGIQVTATCVWARREGWFRHVVGVAFQDMDGGTRQALEALARTQGIGTGAPEERAAA
jgi:hypothetical protein